MKCPTQVRRHETQTNPLRSYKKREVLTGLRKSVWRERAKMVLPAFKGLLPHAHKGKT